MNHIYEIADAVAAVLTDGLSLSGVARRYQPLYALEELDERRITVTPRTVSIAAATRLAAYYDFVVDIGIQQRVEVDSGHNAAVDAIVGLAEQIARHMRSASLPGLPGVAFAAAAIQPVVSVEHLEQHHVATCVVSLTYRTLE